MADIALASASRTASTWRRLIFCADDYGLAPGVSEAIRDLATRGHLNATTAMVVSPHLTQAEADALRRMNTHQTRITIGLHATLSGAFHPLTGSYPHAPGGTFAAMPRLLMRASLRAVEAEAVRAEIAAQIERFTTLFGRLPDFVDGHQHVQLFPVIRDAFLDAVHAHAPQAWVRQCGRPELQTNGGGAKAHLLDRLSAEFRRRAARRGIATNPAFSGAYGYSGGENFAGLLPRFLEGMPDGGLIMCHPGIVDEALPKLDPLTTPREREYAFMKSPAFPALLERHQIALL